ncbi:MAG: peptidoglycan DD-metalloendopeptidase family protein [Bacteroidia bacterium]|nr:peptidoglycan DD-metalloendopeptidase family protein [Bacteroidia bacterium]
MIKKTLLLSALTLFLSHTYAQVSAVPAASVEQDSLEEADMLEAIPAGDWYKQWDTAVVHYYGNSTLEMFANKTLQLVYNKSCDFFYPVPNGPITSHYGPRGRRGRMHKGIDIDLEEGDPVYAAFEGMVRYAQYNSSYGNVVVLRHPNGLETYYAHMSRLDVKPGTYVQAGDHLGLGGNTGRSFGSHLHFEIRFLGQAINPATIIDLSKHELAISEYIPYKMNRNRLDVAGNRTGKISSAVEKFHTVRPGDDLHIIAEQYCVPVTLLMELNNISEHASLLIDSKIRYQ